jgi:hypothetical protein
VAVACGVFARDDGIDCLLAVMPQQQGARKWLVFRIFDDDLGLCDYWETPSGLIPRWNMRSKAWREKCRVVQSMGLYSWLCVGEV